MTMAQPIGHGQNPPSQLLDEAIIVGGCVLLHLMLAEPAGYPLTIAPAAVTLVLVRHYAGRMSMLKMTAWLALLLIPFVNVLGAPSDTLAKFVRTYGLYVFNVSVLWWATAARIDRCRNDIVRGAFAALAVVACFSAAQSGLAFLTGSNALYNIFGNHQYLHLYDTDLHNTGSGSWSRAQGFYLEPSFGALVMVTMWVVCTLANYRVGAAGLIMAGALFFNRSFSGILTFMFLLAIHLGLSLGKRVSLFVKLAVTIGCVLIAAVVLRQVLLARLAELNVEGASAYYRLISPLVVLRDVLQSRPFGVEMGQVESFLAPYGLLQTGSEGNTLDNGLYVLVFYFGWLGIAAVTGLLATIASHIMRGRREAAIFWGYLLLSLGFSGAILVPEYAFLLVLVIYQYRKTRASRNLVSGLGEQPARA